MGTDGTTRIEKALSVEEIAAANGLLRRWFDSRAEPPAAASALGVWPLLTALAAGATRGTRSELLEAAGVGPGRAGDVAAELLAAVRSAPAIRLAIGVWAGARITLDPEWGAKLPAEAIGSLTGDRAADKASLDAWAARETEGLIERMPLDFSRPIDLVLASALLVRTTWVTEFRDGPLEFRTGPWAGLGTVRALWNTIHEDVLRVSDDASVLTVPGRHGIDVLLAVGREDSSPHGVFSSLLDAAEDPAWGRSAAHDLAVGETAPGVEVTEYEAREPQRSPEVAVQTVRFKVGSDLDLTEDAEALGLVRASDGELAEFDCLAVPRTFLNQARQSCAAEFSSAGFKAAAVTAMAMTRAGAVMRPENRHVHKRASIGIDRPFAYAARHRSSGLILVAGWVAEPELET